MAGPQYQMNDPSSSQMMGASPWMGGVPQVGMVGASSADSPPGVAASPSGLPDGWQGILPYAVGAGAGLFGASQAASSNRSAISPLYGAGTPYLVLHRLTTVPDDAPAEYAEAVIENSLSLVSTVVTSDELVTAWKSWA